MRVLTGAKGVRAVYAHGRSGVEAWSMFGWEGGQQRGITWSASMTASQAYGTNCFVDGSSIIVWTTAWYGMCMDVSVGVCKYGTARGLEYVGKNSVSVSIPGQDPFSASAS